MPLPIVRLVPCCRLPGPPRWIWVLTKTSHQTAHDQLGQIVRSALQQRSDDHDERTEEDGLAATQPVTDPDRRNGTRETAQVVSRDDNTWGLRQVNEGSIMGEVRRQLRDSP